MFDINVMRKQFEYIIMQNSVKLTVRIIKNKDATDYFNLGESKELIETDLYFNIHGNLTDAYEDKTWGSVRASKYHVYAMNDVDLDVGDFVIVKDLVYRVDQSSLNKGFVLGTEVIFKEFDITYVFQDQNN